MKNYKHYLLAMSFGGLLFINNTFATNPLIVDQFTADPTARVFEGKVYVYPSHDIPASPGRGRTNWFVMEDYHVFSSENLSDWTDHGVILNQTNVPWLNRTSFDMWAPDCVFKNGKYYFYFPVGGRIGVAVADKPYGPFKPEEKPLAGAGGIDPGVLMDKDGSAYVFWARGRISVARLKENMLELDGPPLVITNLPTAGLIEGPFPFERKGIYYLTYPHVQTRSSGWNTPPAPIRWDLTNQRESSWMKPPAVAGRFINPWLNFRASGICFITTKIYPRNLTRTGPSEPTNFISMKTEPFRRSSPPSAESGLWMPKAKSKLTVIVPSARRA